MRTRRRGSGWVYCVYQHDTHTYYIHVDMFKVTKNSFLLLLIKLPPGSLPYHGTTSSTLLGR